MIPMADLRALHAPIQEELEAAVVRVLRSGQYCLGPEVEAFEREFADYSGCAYGVGVNSGTSALQLALLACGVGPGDEVVTVPFTFIATAAAIRYCGARPVFVDIEPAGYLMDVARLEAAVTPRTKAIVPVHLYGQMAGMDAILEVAKRHGLAVVEDAAQAHGAEYRGRRAGSMGDLGIFSFYPAKNLGACGEGGLVVGNEPRFESALRSLRSWGVGEPGRYVHETEGFNYRMDNIQGAVLRVKLRRLEEWTRARQASAAVYDAALAGRVETPRVLPGRRHVYQQYVVRVREREAVRERLSAAGVASAVFYPVPLHLLPAYAGLGHRAGEFPVAERSAGEVLALPLSTPENCARVAEVLKEAVPA